MPKFSSEGRLEHVENGNWPKWLEKFKASPKARGLEIGCFEGRASLWFLDNILQGEDAQLHVVDTFLGADDHHAAGLDCSLLFQYFYDNLRSYVDFNRCVIHQGRSQEVLPGLIKSKFAFDFIYVDASHHAHDVFLDSAFSWLLLKSGGVIIFDDVEWKFRGPLSEPKIAVESFLSCFEGQYKILGKGWQIAIEKT